MAVRIGVVGVGFGVTVHVPAFQSEGLEVVAICARHAGRAEAAAKQFGIPQVFTDWRELVASPDLDAVSVVTPTALHHPIALSALEAGKHVLLEKPFTLNLDEARSLAEAAAASDRTTMIAHEFRYASARMRAKELIAEGYLGDLRLALVRLFRDPGPQGTLAAFRGDRDMAASKLGFLHSLGSHYIDGLRHLFGEVTAASGEMITFQPDRLGENGEIVKVDADDTFLFRLFFEGGGVAEMVASRQTPFGDVATMEFYGSAGTLLTPQTGMNPPAHGTLIGGRRGDAALAELEIPERLQPFVDDRDDRLMPFRLLTRDFLRGIESGTSPAPNFDDGYACQQILDALEESSRSGGRVAIPSR
ncbi:MAG TPA: Gfo/Idh/MocA family oxidoreductase [Acidimicrobiales bacterium]|nr:Gfo/Idh/MocA family oxidoreductase [Acidimicrobiales bacterium]